MRHPFRKPSTAPSFSLLRACGVMLASSRASKSNPMTTPPPGSFQPDNGARSVDAALLRLLIDIELRKAQRLRYCISVICICANVISTEVCADGVLLDHFRRQLRTTDAIAHWPPASLALLLVDADSEHIPAVMRRITTQLAEGSWRAGAISYPRSNWGVDEMLRRAAHLMERALSEPGEPLYLA